MKAQDLRKVKRSLRRQFDLACCRWLYPTRAKYECPICGYNGPFLDVNDKIGPRKHARCPDCGGVERHRLQFVVTESLLRDRDTSQQRILHFAPEPFFRQWFQGRFARYDSADLNMDLVDLRVDLRRLPFATNSYDFVFASHVLEHIQEDMAAIREIRRVLRTDGIAILPVPLISSATVEYPEPSPHEHGHVRAPGNDYFDRYERHFPRVELYSSESFPEKHQLYIYEDRTVFPNDKAPLRPAMAGERHLAIVPVCYASDRQS